jgi:hypothetical protein
MAKKYGTTMLSGSEKEKRTPKFLRKIFESPARKSERLSTAKGKANKAASAKMSAGESMFAARKMAEANVAKAKSAISAARRDEGKTKLRPMTPATAKDRAKVRIAPKGSIKDPRKALDAETKKSYQKRIDYMEKRKAAGKNYSKKNLADLKAKLK